MSARGLSQWARDRERQRGERPRRYWSRQRGTRHDLEHAATSEQLELDMISPVLGRSGAGEEARAAEIPHAARGRGLAGAPAPAAPRRPTVAECALEPWRCFE